MTRLAAVSLAFASLTFGQRPAPLVNTGPRAPLINTGPQTPIVNTGATGYGYVRNLGTSVSGVGPKYYGRGGGGAGRGHAPRTVVIPYGVPVYYGDPNAGYAPPEQPPQEQQPNITIINPPAQTPMVIINQGYVPDRANPVLRDYSNSDLPETGPSQDSSSVKVYRAPNPGAEAAAAAAPEQKATIFLIALKDGTVHSAIGYWVQDHTFGYITPGAKITRVDLSQLDRDTTERLNKDRNVDFDLRED